MLIKAKSDAKVNNIMVEKGENEVPEYVAEQLRAAGLLVEEKKEEKKETKKKTKASSKKKSKKKTTKKKD